MVLCAAKETRKTTGKLTPWEDVFINTRKDILYVSARDNNHLPICVGIPPDDEGHIEGNIFQGGSLCTELPVMFACRCQVQLSILAITCNQSFPVQPWYGKPSPVELLALLDPNLMQGHQGHTILLLLLPASPDH